MQLTFERQRLWLSQIIDERTAKLTQDLALQKAW